MRLSNFTDYSLRVLIYLVLKGEERSTVSEIADKYGISKNHLVKVVHNLSSLGIIKSFKGKGGGIVLQQSPEKIIIGKLVREFESDSHLVECFSSNGKCAIDPTCKLKSALRKAELNFYKTLEGFTLADIVSNRKQLSKSLTLSY
tara:strand:- start:173143 stop:173577 length:435 start_codon:yes stop_codon:yes gene_type:complete